MHMPSKIRLPLCDRTHAMREFTQDQRDFSRVARLAAIQSRETQYQVAGI
jgi:hypothetical protein